MRSIRGQLILSHILPFVILLPLVLLLVLYLVEAQLLVRELGDNLQERANLIAQALQEQPQVLSETAAAAAFLDEVGTMVEGQVFLLDQDGNLLAAGPLGEGTPLATLEPLRDATTVIFEETLVVEHGLLEQQGEATAPVIDVNQELLGVVGVRESLSGVESTIGRLRRYVGWTLLGGMLVGGLVGLALAYRLSKPIVEAADAVRAISSGRSIDPIEVSGPAELRRLGNSVNILNDRLRLLEQTRQRSLANIVHELGRPLGAIHAAIHVLNTEKGNDPEIRQELLAGVETELSAMEPLLDDLTLIHDDVTGAGQLSPQWVDTSEWLRATLLPWRVVAEQKGIDWSTAVPDALPPIYMDPDRMSQVVGNLVSNSVKYSPGGATVTVTAGVEDSVLTIAVTDTGPGIVVDEQERIFEPFYRSRRPQRFSKGLGLGLAIARSLTEAHGGTLTLESTPGAGSTFTVTLPLARLPAVTETTGSLAYLGTATAA